MELFNFNNSSDEIIKGKIILINKPKLWSSFQVVNKIRYILSKTYKIKKLKTGHAGTLDPLASGLLILAVGKATKLIHHLQEMSKVYNGEFCFGSTTPSYDLETTPNKKFSYKHLNKQMIINKTKDFIGLIDQKPPIFSAIKKKGKRLYEYARNKEHIEISPRKIEIKRFKIKSVNLPKVIFEVECSKGTYIRSLAHDFGTSLESGAHLSQLKRTSIGKYKIENDKKISDFEKLI